MDNLVEWHCRVDSSGRISLPQQCREWLKDGCVLRYYPDENCIGGWPVSKQIDDDNDAFWAEMEDWLGKKLDGPVIHTADDPNKLYLDARGRLTIPTTLREQASITGAVVVIAIWRYFEVWSEKAWRSFLEYWKTDKHPFLGDYPDAPKWVDEILDSHISP